MDERPPPPAPGWWLGRVKSFGWAFAGLAHCLRTQANAQIHLGATIIVVTVGCWVGLATWEWCAVIGAIALVWMAETFNTAIEMFVDLVSPERRPLAGKIKDVAAGAVLAAAMGALAIGVLICWRRIWPHG